MTILDNWIAWTLLAAVMQSVRTAGQKHLSGEISPLAATMVRYLFGLPFAFAYLAGVAASRQFDLPSLNWTFLACAFLAGVLQIVATVLLVHLFTQRNFAVGSTYARTEVMITAILGFIFFSEAITSLGWAAIVMCVAGVLLINLSRTGGPGGIWNRSATFGVGAGLAFSLTSLLIRRASRSFGIDDSMLTAAMTLSYMVAWQTLISVAWLLLTEKGQFTRAIVRWRLGTFVGLTSVIGSAGWFTAFTLEYASYVKTLGQVEFLVTLCIGWFYFHERPTRLEFGGMFLIVAAVVVLLTASR